MNNIVKALAIIIEKRKTNCAVCSDLVIIKPLLKVEVCVIKMSCPFGKVLVCTSLYFPMYHHHTNSQLLPEALFFNLILIKGDRSSYLAFFSS